MFSLVGRLPSMPSANGFPRLFGHFVGTVRPSDSPSTCMLDFWFMTFSNRPVHEIVTGVAGASRFSRMEFPCMLGVSDCAESFESSRWRFHQCGLPSRWTTSALRIDLFRSSISRLHVPLSTLHEQPCDWPRMTRGQGGSLRLPCVTLSFTTPYRFLPAHPPYRRVRLRRVSAFGPPGRGGQSFFFPQSFPPFRVSFLAFPPFYPPKPRRTRLLGPLPPPGST